MCTPFGRQERRVYYKHRYKARRFPDKYLTVMMGWIRKQQTFPGCVVKQKRHVIWHLLEHTLLVQFSILGNLQLVKIFMALLISTSGPVTQIWRHQFISKWLPSGVSSTNCLPSFTSNLTTVSRKIKISIWCGSLLFWLSFLCLIRLVLVV